MTDNCTEVFVLGRTFTLSPEMYLNMKFKKSKCVHLASVVSKIKKTQTGSVVILITVSLTTDLY